MANRPQELLLLLTRAERLSARRVEQVLAEFDCSVEEWRVLALLSDGQGHNMTAIADCAFLPPPSLTKLVDRLVDQNLVYRRTDPVDRRRILAQLTPRGREFWQRIDRRVRAELAPLLDPEDGEQLRVLLERLAGTLDGGGAVTTGRTGNGVGRAR
ncbi:MarR family winged helix-turn-helix transcriptional regulator [Streptomyces cylindrosporus]|uniref:MarR family transcriptional regulator n=1 Tax=Streptomyces cylindrosporus TaxID=2927583 RepID=A0ABS9Y379_9ACTN|nr:MarR family transcriptional regulator [Streptomyces cylindrosporus]MCI3271454.1 MarR family transcriptional regulator [Streptomyces cylindrosporus]